MVFETVGRRGLHCSSVSPLSLKMLAWSSMSCSMNLSGELVAVSLGVTSSMSFPDDVANVDVVLHPPFSGAQMGCEAR